MSGASGAFAPLVNLMFSPARSACVRGGDDPLLWRTQSLEAPRLFLAIAKLCFALIEHATLQPRGHGHGRRDWNAPTIFFLFYCGLTFKVSGWHRQDGFGPE